jgi:hypothetical protein
MRPAHRKAVVLAVGLGISAVALAYFVRLMRGQWGGMGAAFASADYAYLVPAVGFIGVMYALRVLRWRLFLSRFGPVAYRHILSATMIGFMSSCVLPLRPGEVIRPYVLHRKAGVKFGHAAGSAMGLERVFDLIGVCFLLVLAWVALWLHARGAGAASSAHGSKVAEFAAEVTHRGLLFAALTGLGLVCLGAVAFLPRPMLRVAEFFLRRLPAGWRRPLSSFVESIAESLGFLRGPGQVVGALGLSFAIWLCFPLSTYSLARGFGLDLPFAGALVAQVIVTAAVAVPQAPGFFGVFQVAAAKGVELFGVGKGDAGAFAMMLWAIHVIPITAVGLGFMWREGLSLGRLMAASEEEAGEGSGPTATPK